MAAADSELLFGLLALQNGMVTRDQLVAAFGTWTASPGRRIADLLVEQGALTESRRALLIALADEHLAAHGDDPQMSLAALDLGRSARTGLASVGPILEATLARVGTGLGAEPGADRTATYEVGAAAAGEQRYRILRPHARGGLGAVFVALDGELHREVALKQILDDYADDPVSRRRFLVEAEVTGGLEHPGIVPVYGLGHYGDGRPYYAMRFIRGDSLKDAVTSFHSDATLDGDPGAKSLELRKLLRRFIDVCNAIDYAHSRGVLHRDIKPGNVIVGKHGETLVVDWGLAKPLGRREGATAEKTLVPISASDGAETLTGSALGTPAYMSPEQAAGDTGNLGPRSDIYSLGATLYFLLAGRPPFDGHDVGGILRRVQRGEFPPPRTVKPLTPRPLEAVCLKAMSQRPEDRYASARGLAEDVERWTADEPVTAAREGVSAKLSRKVRRHPAIAAWASLCIVADIGALITILQMSYFESKTSPPSPEERRVRFEASAHERLHDFLARVNKLTDLSVSDKTIARDLVINRMSQSRLSALNKMNSVVSRPAMLTTYPIFVSLLVSQVACCFGATVGLMVGWTRRQPGRGWYGGASFGFKAGLLLGLVSTLVVFAVLPLALQ